MVGARGVSPVSMVVNGSICPSNMLSTVGGTKTGAAGLSTLSLTISTNSTGTMGIILVNIVTSRVSLGHSI